MPPARAAARPKVTSNENDENGPTTRLTRAKSAALSADATSNGGGALAGKKPLQSKRSTSSNTLIGNAVAQPQRKRAALGDVSNVTKSTVIEAKKVKKTLTSKSSGLPTKASQVAGVQKAGTRANQARSASQRTFTVEVDALKHVEVRGDNDEVVERASQEMHAAVSATATVGHDDAAATTNATVEPAIPNLDAAELDDPLLVAEYAVEIFEYLRVLEDKTMPNAEYMDHQPELEWKMRGILVDWLIEVHTRFMLLPETLFLAVNIVDRFLSLKVVQLDKFQLVGVTALFIASKYEEVLTPHVGNFRHVADDGFTIDEILATERYMLGALNYDLSYPNPMNFLRRITKADNYDIRTRTLGKYLMEISLLDHRFMEYRPSHIASTAMFLARIILERGEWDATLAHYAGYTTKDMEPCFNLMVAYLAQPVAHEAFFKKYASKKFLKASILSRQWAKKYYTNASSSA
ncbi:MAG: hypothetical protein M1823_001743 [Watsoniomyces obsoletus]|nr:MAG: hypothetical protein M1823_001743 [Watsoniomyces obsoletus]